VGDWTVPCVSEDQSLCCAAWRHDERYPYCDSSPTPKHTKQSTDCQSLSKLIVHWSSIWYVPWHCLVTHHVVKVKYINWFTGKNVTPLQSVLLHHNCYINIVPCMWTWESTAPLHFLLWINKIFILLSECGDVFIPWTRTTWLGRRSFFIAAPVVWNSLPLHLRCSVRKVVVSFGQSSRLIFSGWPFTDFSSENYYKRLNWTELKIHTERQTMHITDITVNIQKLQPDTTTCSLNTRHYRYLECLVRVVTDIIIGKCLKHLQIRTEQNKWYIIPCLSNEYK